MSAHQVQRVLRALQTAGTRGVTAVDFSAPDVIDGGPPITRVAARVKDLRNAGHKIDVTGKRNKCAVYVLEQRVPAPAAAPTEDDDWPDWRPRPATAVGAGSLLDDDPDWRL